jgi:hypothetical protein
MEGADPSLDAVTEQTWNLPSSRLFGSSQLSVFEVTLVEAPEYVRRLGLLRSDAYSGLGPWNYGLDDYDQHAVQLVAVEPGDDDPVGALRVSLGDVIVEQLGMNSLYLHRFFDFGPGAPEFFKSTMEYGRVWVTPSHPRSLSILHSLLQALGAFVATRESYQGVCGTVSLLDFPPSSRAHVARYLREYHRWEEPFLKPRFPLAVEPHPTEAEGGAPRSQAEAFRSLVRVLRSIDKAHRLPPSLHIYLRHGARLLGDVAMDKSGRKMLIPLYVPRRAFLSELEVIRPLARVSASPLEQLGQSGA